MAEPRKVSDATRKKTFLRWIYGNLTCFSQEHMQTFGYLAAMLPVVDELYDTDEEKVNALRTYTAFFNTEPQIGTMVVGLTVGLEEARANGETIDDETNQTASVPVSWARCRSRCDSIIVGTFIPILLGILPRTLDRRLDPRPPSLHHSPGTWSRTSAHEICVQLGLQAW